MFFFSNFHNFSRIFTDIDIFSKFPSKFLCFEKSKFSRNVLEIVVIRWVTHLIVLFYLIKADFSFIYICHTVATHSSYNSHQSIKFFISKCLQKRYLSKFLIFSSSFQLYKSRKMINFFLLYSFPILKLFATL